MQEMTGLYHKFLV